MAATMEPAVGERRRGAHRVWVLLVAAIGLVVWQASGLGSAVAAAEPAGPERTSQQSPGIDPSAVAAAVSATQERLVSPVAQSTLQGTPDVAFDGTNHLVVWAEARGALQSIVAARVDPAGSILDPNGIVIIDGSFGGERYNPAVTFAGDHYFVVWEDNVFGQGFFIAGRGVTPGGAFTGEAMFISDFDGPEESRADIAFDGTNSMVVWQRDGLDVFGARVAGDGTVVQQSIPVSDEAGAQVTPAVAFNGTGYMAVWQDNRSGSADIHGARVTTAGVVTDATGFAVTSASGNDTAPDIDWGGGQHLVTWVNSGTGVRAARVSSAAVVADATSIALPSGVAPGFPAAAFNGTTHQVVWSDARNERYDVFGARVGTDGAVLDATARTVASAAGDEIWPALAVGGGNVLAVWDDNTFGPGERDVLGGRISTSGTLIDASTRLIATRVVSQTRPAVAFDGTNHLVVWQDNRTNADGDLYSARMTADGALLDPRGFQFSGPGSGEFFPDVAFGGGTYFVVYQQDPPGANNANIIGQRISTLGVPTGTSVVISNAVNDQSEPTVVFDGTNFLVAWTDFRSGAGDIYATRVTPTGTVLTPAGFPVSTATGLQSAPAAAFDGTNSLVVWSDNRNATSDIYGARVTPADAVLDAAGIGIQTDGFSQFRPEVAFGGGTYMVAWDESGDIWGSRVTPAGVVSEPAGIPLSTAPDNQDSPAVAFNGSFLVVWNDRRSGATYDIYGTRVATDGTVSDPSGIALSTGSTNELSPAVTRANTGWSVAYQHELPGGTGIFRRGAK